MEEKLTLTKGEAQALSFLLSTCHCYTEEIRELDMKILDFLNKEGT